MVRACGGAGGRAQGVVAFTGGGGDASSGSGRSTGAWGPAARGIHGATGGKGGGRQCLHQQRRRRLQQVNGARCRGRRRGLHRGGGEMWNGRPVGSV